MNVFTLSVLSISIILQLAAAVYALRLNRKIHGVGYAWLLIAAALTFMAARRIVTFIGFFSPQVEATVKGPIAESIALLIAVLMLFGVLLIPRIFDSLQETTEAWQASEARYRTLIDSIEDIIFSLDRNGRFITINNNTLSRLGWPEDSLTSKSIHDFYSAPEAAFYETKYRQVLETGLAVHFERNSTTVLGKFWFSVSLNPIPNEAGETMAISCMLRDITKQKQLEQQTIALHKIALDITARRDMTELLNAIAARAVKLLGAAGSSIYIADSNRETLSLMAVQGAGEKFMHTQLKRGEGVAGRVLASGQPLVIEDYDQWQGRAAVYPRGCWQAVAGVPLFFADQVIGVLSCYEIAGSSRTFDEANVQMLASLGQQAAIAIENARLLTATARRTSELVVLMRLGQAISANLNLDTILETTYQSVGELMDNDAFWISSYEANAAYSQYLLKIDRDVRYPLDEFPVEAGIGGYVIRTGKTVLADHPARKKAFSLARYGSSTSVKSVLCVPLLIGDQIIGAMSTQSYTPNAYSEEDLELLELFQNKRERQITPFPIFEP